LPPISSRSKQPHRPHNQRNNRHGVGNPDDFRSGKRTWGVMNATAFALTEQDSAEVAAYSPIDSRGGRRCPVKGFQRVGAVCDSATRAPARSLPAIRTEEFRQVPPLWFCTRKLGAPPLRSQHAEYIERQLSGFAQRTRQNDINQQMRIITHELTFDEMHALAAYYFAASHRD
jgi:cytochrome c553